MKFWENEKWIEKITEKQPEFIDIIKNGKDIDMEWSTFSLTIDGVKHKLEMLDFDEKYQIIVKKYEID